MSARDELARVLTLADEGLLAILHQGEASARIGVLIVVGGPQYRVGSHRQFVLLARRLAVQGYPVLRFDYRGMGDSSGERREFQAVGEDIAAALECLCRDAAVEHVVLWGLCDAASAILMHAASDPRVAGMVLLNPWVHSPAGEARARLKTYYGARLRNPKFWRKLIRLEVDWRDSASSLIRYARRAWLRPGVQAPRDDDPVTLPFVDRMQRGWAASPAPSLVILSGDDLTAAEFRALVSSDPGWQALTARQDVECLEVPDANHTFARADWRRVVEDATLAWLARLPK